MRRPPRPEHGRLAGDDLGDRAPDAELGRHDRVARRERRGQRAAARRAGERAGGANGAIRRRAEPAVALRLLLLRGRRRGPAALPLELPRRADLGPQLLELGPHARELRLGLRQRALPLGRRRRPHLLDLVLETLGGALRLEPSRLRLRAARRRALASELVRLARGCLGLGDELGDLQPLRRDALARGRDDRRRQPEPLRRLQRVGGSGPAERHRVERLVRLRIDPGGGVGGAVGRARPLLQLREVARRHGEPRLRREAVEQRLARAPHPRRGRCRRRSRRGARATRPSPARGSRRGSAGARRTSRGSSRSTARRRCRRGSRRTRAAPPRPRAGAGRTGRARPRGRASSAPRSCRPCSAR